LYEYVHKIVMERRGSQASCLAEDYTNPSSNVRWLPTNPARSPDHLHGENRNSCVPAGKVLPASPPAEAAALPVEDHYRTLRLWDHL